MQNTLSCIQHKIQNEIRYSIQYRVIVKQQIQAMDITQQTFFDEQKGAVDVEKYV